MKYLLILVFLTTLTSITADAAQGRAAIPHFIVDSSGFRTRFYLSNITNKDLEVEVDLYNIDGTLMQDDNTSTSGVVRLSPQSQTNNYSENGGFTAKFTIAPHQTVSLTLQPVTFNVGHGFIRWNQNGTRRKAMLAHGRASRAQTSREVSWAVPINNGKSF